MRNLLWLFAAASISGCACHTTEPGERSVLVVWGKLQEPALGEGFHTATFGSDYTDVSIRTQKHELNAECFSSDLQNVQMNLAVLYRIPEARVIDVFRQYHGEPFDVLIAPRAQEAIKEATASRSAEHIVKDREKVKAEALDALKTKVGDVLVIEDLIIVDVKLSAQLAQAIEQKMVQEQEAAKAKFTKLKAEIEAEIVTAQAKGEADAALLRAKADAEAIKIRGEALRQNTGVVELQLIEKWDGVSPQIVAGGGGLNLILPALKQK